MTRIMVPVLLMLALGGCAVASAGASVVGAAANVAGSAAGAAINVSGKAAGGAVDLATGGDDND